jgi:hypothetical protein
MVLTPPDLPDSFRIFCHTPMAPIFHRSASVGSKIAIICSDPISNVQDIHFHVWDSDAFYEFIVACKRHYQLPLEIILHARNGFENICILQKQA